jgi:hypothetical protein
LPDAWAQAGLRRLISEAIMASSSGNSSASARVCDAIAVATATAYVAWKLHPGLLLLPTITTGGDTASHYYTAWWLRHELLPQGRIGGWVPGNYAGFPLFQVYFPLPFVLIALLSLPIGLPIAFKLVTVSGLVGLPAAAYVCFRLLDFAFPAPALAALFTLPFLFHEADAMWGGNVGSTLAGEFTYSFSVALLLLFAGTLYRGVASGRGRVGNAVLLAAIALSHAYTVLVAAALGAYLVLFHPRGRRALPYLVSMALIAFGLIAFWAVPLLAYAGYTTAYSIVWPIQGFRHVFPVVLWPLLTILAAGALAAPLARRRRPVALRGSPFDHRVGYLVALAAGGLLLYLVAWRLDVVDIRFLPFVQLTGCLLAALPAAAMLRAVAGFYRRDTVVPVAAGVLLLAVVTLIWVDAHVGVADDWAAWNYGGFEATPGWPAYREVIQAVRRSSADPRVAYEHSPAHDEAGTVRAFESLPLFAGASTLEGLYMQSSISSPFVFYIQSEISQVGSCPLLPYHCSHLDAARAAEHLRLFNVTELIARSDEVKRVMAASPDFRLERQVPPYTVFAVAGGSGSYVEPLRYEPLLLTSGEWKRDFFAWFKRPGAGEVPLVRPLPGSEAPGEWLRVDGLPDSIPRRPLHGDVEVSAELQVERIRIHTSAPGRPLLVKVSYHPRWHVEGANAVWLASPSFMLVVPIANDVDLTYRRSAIDWAALLITWGTMAWLAVALPAGRLRWWSRNRSATFDGAPPARASGVTRALDVLFRYRSLWAPAVLVVLALGALWVRAGYSDPWVPHRDGLTRFHDGEYAAAEPLFRASIAAAPSSSAAYYSTYYLALCAYRSRHWQETLTRFTAFLRDYPGGELVGEASFRIGEALQELGRTDDALAQFIRVMDRFSDTQWAAFSAQRIAALVPQPARGDNTAPSAGVGRP